jgi:hypothetical protein
MPQTKFFGIDERLIKCSDPNPDTIEAGISFDKLEDGTNVLRFHFLEQLPSGILTQTTKSMHLNGENISLLGASISGIKKDIEQNCKSCEDLNGAYMYLGTTCPECNRPFRQVKI